MAKKVRPTDSQLSFCFDCTTQSNCIEEAVGDRRQKASVVDFALFVRQKNRLSESNSTVDRLLMEAKRLTW